MSCTLQLLYNIIVIYTDDGIIAVLVYHMYYIVTYIVGPCLNTTKLPSSSFDSSQVRVQHRVYCSSVSLVIRQQNTYFTIEKSCNIKYNIKPIRLQCTYTSSSTATGPFFQYSTVHTQQTFMRYSKNIIIYSIIYNKFSSDIETGVLETHTFYNLSQQSEPAAAAANR